MRKPTFALISVALGLAACVDGDDPVVPAGDGPPAMVGGPAGYGGNGNQAGGRVDPRDDGLTYVCQIHPEMRATLNVR
jgi:hypothetical protein